MMATSNAFREALETEVTATVDTLAQLLSADPSEDDGEIDPEPLRQLGERLSQVGIVAGEQGLFGLHDVCTLFQAGLLEIAEQGRPLAPGELDLLLQWPERMIDYLDAPQDLATGRALVELLSHPEWTQPIPEDEASMLGELLVFSPEEATPGASAGWSTDPAHESALEGSLPRSEEVEPVLGEPFALAEAVGPADGRVPDLAAAPIVAIDHVDTLEDTSSGVQDEVSALEESTAFADEVTSVQEAASPLDSDPNAIEPSQGTDVRPPDLVSKLSSKGEAPIQEEANAHARGATAVQEPASPEDIGPRGVELSQGAEDPAGIIETPPSEDRSPLLRANIVATDDLDSVPGRQDLPAAQGANRFASQERALSDPASVFDALAAVGDERVAGNASVPTDDVPDIPFSSPLSEQDDVTGASVATEQDAVCELGASDDDIHTDSEISAPCVNRELVALLEAEVQDIAPAFDEALGQTAAEDRGPLFESLAEVMARMAEAADAVEMLSLSQVCAHTGNNLAILAENTGVGEPSVLEAWPAMVLAYLAAPSDLERCRELVGYLQRPGWPYELDVDFAAELVQGLRMELVDTAPEPAEQRQAQATAADTSLAVPQDVNQELLESLLLELPGLTAQFSATIHRLSKGEGSLEELTTAQRAAHTLKGAANTVGVVGIATLAHHVEDILQALSKQDELPAGPLADCLIDASDCLEMMAEALLGIGEAPEEATRVLQQVLDWANWIDHNGLPTGQQSLPVLAYEELSEDGVEAGDATGSTAESAPYAPSSSHKVQATAIPTARTTVSQADELLRLSGELNILHGQLTNRLERALGDVNAWQEHGSVLQQLAIELEQMVDIRGITWAKSKGTTGDRFDPLEMDQYNELHTLSRRLMEAASDARELGQQVNSHFNSMNALFVAQSRLQRDNEETVLRTRMVPAQTLVARLQRSVRQTCRVAEKQADLRVIGADTLIDSEVLNALTDPLMHLLRNAVDHGIEPAHERLARNKPEAGSITLEFGRSGNHIMIRCRDDGAGLDLEAVRHKAEQHNLIRPDQPLSNEELSRLILRPGFSTRDVSSQVSGRGIGMDAVYHGVQKLKGSLQLRSEPGVGLVVELLLPASLLSSHGVLVRCGGQRIAISSRGVEQILPPGAGELGHLGDYETFRLGEDVYEALQLETLLYAKTPTDAGDPRPALLVRDSAGATRAVLVEEVLESRTLVVKSMGEYVPKLQGIVGATILGDGSVAPVVDLEALVREPVGESLNSVSQLSDRPQSVSRRQPRALVVDDSLSARRSMSQFLEDAGFEVETALDGLDAVAMMQKALPEILMVDLEMPRMNGLELTRHVRANAATQHLPVIMVTSRSTDKHRREAQVAGVSAYVNKPFAEDELLRIISELTALRGAA